MRKILIGFIGIFLVINMAGCFGGDDAKTATKNFYDAMRDGDVKKYKKYSTESTQRMIGITLSMQCSKKGIATMKTMETDEETAQCMKKTFSELKKVKIVHVEEHDPTSATVTVEQYSKSGNISKNKVKVEKLGGQWKVDLKK